MPDLKSPAPGRGTLNFMSKAEQPKFIRHMGGFYGYGYKCL